MIRLRPTRETTTDSHLSGLVKSPVSTTATQVLTRVIQVWMIWWWFPVSTAASRAFPALVLAWALADSIRYLYLAANLHGVAPGWLVWLRYVVLCPRRLRLMGDVSGWMLGVCRGLS